MTEDWTIRCITHPWDGQRVVHPPTGRIGTLGTVIQYTARGSDRVVREEAHMRPVDGSGREWRAPLRELLRSDECTRPEPRTTSRRT